MIQKERIHNLLQVRLANRLKRTAGELGDGGDNQKVARLNAARKKQRSVHCLCPAEAKKL